ncbi:MAG: NUDIX domain-containing protein [Planctomycetota bacterium]
MNHAAHGSTTELPYKLACLCDLRDADGRVLLLERKRTPNKGLFSPIGGKLDVATGESPAQCAVREIKEEAGIDVPIERLHLGGLIAETAFEGRGHWLLFYYRVLGPVVVPEHEIDEGKLAWHPHDAIDALALPETDRKIIWPLIREHEAGPGQTRPGFFAAHIDCTAPELTWSIEQSEPAIV